LSRLADAVIHARDDALILRAANGGVASDSVTGSQHGAGQISSAGNALPDQAPEPVFIYRRTNNGIDQKRLKIIPCRIRISNDARFTRLTVIRHFRRIYTIKSDARPVTVDRITVNGVNILTDRDIKIDRSLRFCLRCSHCKKNNTESEEGAHYAAFLAAV
jgi:hypothetical protein